MSRALLRGRISPLFAGADPTRVGALGANTGGFDTASGAVAMELNADDDGNTAIYALGGNTTGSGNTAGGYGAIESNSTGSDNTACGY